MTKAGVLSLTDWPQTHRELWEAGIRPPLLPGDCRGAGALWRKDTLEIIEKGWGRWSFWLTEMDWLDPTQPPAGLITPDRLRGYVRHLGEHNKPATILTRIIALERAVAVLAPEADRSLLKRWGAELKSNYIPISKREQLQEVAMLTELGFTLMKQARTNDGRERRSAALFRDGIQIALLAARPIRLKNFAGIRIGQHLKQVGGKWRLQFKAHEMKNNKPMELDFPDDLVEALEHYISDPRKVLCGDRYHDNALWVSHWWRPQDRDTIYGRICKRTREAYGLPITPHLFRDCAATSLAVHSPQEVGIAHLILGNSYAKMQKHYNLARSLDASREMQAAMARRREERS